MSSSSRNGAIVQANRTIILGIDFGTTGSGFMHSHPGEKPENAIKEFLMYPEQENPCVKTITALLYKDGVPEAWGWLAQKQFIQSTERERRLNNYQFFKEFKLALHDDSGHAELPDEMDPVQLVADYLRFISSFALEKVRQSYGPGFHTDLVQWCLTVPALWGDATKNKMRQAAVRAGMVKDPDALVLVYEPEAAALCAKARLSDSMALVQARDVFMVVDAGGGTTDVTVHRAVERNGTIVLAETTHRQGEMVGACDVDKEFRAHFQREVGDKAYKQWTAEHPGDALLLDAEWERMKCRFSGGDNPTDRPEYVTVPQSLLDIMTPEDRAALSYEEGDDVYDDRVPLPAKTIQRFFDPTVKRVVKLVQQQLRAPGSRHCDKVLLVGGFAESPYLQQHVRAAVRELDCSILIPPYPQKAVIEGAVRFGCNPDLIYARRSRLSYGIRMATEYEDGAPSKFWVPEEGCYFTDSAFCQFVSRNQLVQVDEVVEHIVHPLYSGQRHCDIDLFATEATDAKYVVETRGGAGSEMQKVAVLQVVLPEDMVDHANHNIRVQLRFGRTEITLAASDLQTGREYEARVVFSHKKVPL